MKKVVFFLKMVFLSISMISLFVQCDMEECDTNLNEVVGEEQFTVRYERPDGTNYLESVYRKDKVVVYLDKSGGIEDIPEYIQLIPGYENGVFGPFRFTEEFFDPTTNSLLLENLLNQPKRYNYHIKKDTFGEDTLTVEFLLGSNGCNYIWQYIRYFRNGEPFVPADPQRAEFLFVE